MYKWLYIALSLAACSSPPPKPQEPKVTADDLRRDTEKALDTAQKLIAQTKADYVAKTEARLKKLDADLDALKADIQKKKGKAKKASEDQWAELKKQRDTLAAELADARKETGEKWDQATKKVDAAADAVEASYQDLKKRLEKL
jgi:TolA-binding protein